MSPYDWNESLAQREQYIDNRLASGIPVLAVSNPDGILCVTLRRQSRKIFEIYDRLLMSAVGIQSDVEAIRTASIEFCHQEGWQRSEDDVTIQRVVSAISQPVKRAFSDLRTAPLIARMLFAELGLKPEEDKFMILAADGDFHATKDRAVLGGTPEIEAEMSEKFATLKLGKNPAKALKDFLRDNLGGKGSELEVEAALLERAAPTDRRFRLL